MELKPCPFCGAEVRVREYLPPVLELSKYCVNVG